MGVMAAPPQPPNGISGGSVPSFVPFCCIPDGRWVWLWRGGRALCASTAPYLALQIWTGSSTSCESIQGGGGQGWKLPAQSSPWGCYWGGRGHCVALSPSMASQPAEDRAAGDGQRADHPPALRGAHHPGARPPRLPAPVLRVRADEGKDPPPPPSHPPGLSTNFCTLLHAEPCSLLPLQKMLQCPYFFFDVVYIHNGAEEKEDETSWKVCVERAGGDGAVPPPPLYPHPVPLRSCMPSSAAWTPRAPTTGTR